MNYTKVLVITILFLFIKLNSIAQKNCGFKIDTATILANHNLNSFLIKFQTDSFKITNNKKDIPKYVKKQLDCLTGGFSIANPGKPYNLTDAVDPMLPYRQLIFLAKSNDVLIMSYHSRMGLPQQMLFVKFEGGRIVDLWTGHTFDNARSKEEIINSIKKQRDKEQGLNTNCIYL